MKRLVLVDGHAILHRAYHAYPPLTTSKGELINAVYGFTSILLTVLRQLHPEFVAVAFDLPKPTFRHKEYKKYKAHRPKVDQELIDQIPKTKGIVRVLNIPIFEKEGWEADDVIGTLVRQAFLLGLSGIANFSSRDRRLKSAIPKQLEVIIVTGDKDALQLINGQVKVFFPARGKQPAVVFDQERFLAKYGFEPKKLVDFKALAGDQSDGIPGVKGIGPKTAQKLIQKFGNFKNIYKNISEIEPKASLKLKEQQKEAELSYHLAQIVTDVPIKLELSKCRLCDYDKNKAIQLFEELEFKSLIKRLPRDWRELEEGERRMNSANPKINQKTEEKKEAQMGLF